MVKITKMFPHQHIRKKKFKMTGNFTFLQLTKKIFRSSSTDPTGLQPVTSSGLSMES